MFQACHDNPGRPVGEEQLNQQGLTLGAAYLSEEGKLRPASWHCEARYPALRAGKTLAVRVRAAAGCCRLIYCWLRHSPQRTTSGHLAECSVGDLPSLASRA